MNAWRRQRVLTRADYGALALLAGASLLCVGALFRGNTTLDTSAGFVWVAPLIALGFVFALFGIWMEQERHGLVRAFAVGGAVALAVAGAIFAGEAPASQLVLFYWVPAILAMLAALVVERNHRLLRRTGDEAPVTARRRAPLTNRQLRARAR
jgi:peptidoglycan/LPS O-acetylase OafA/YrhL